MVFFLYENIKRTDVSNHIADSNDNTHHTETAPSEMLPSNL